MRTARSWKSAVGAVCAALAVRPGRYVVRGESMAPTLLPGDRLVVVRGVHHLAAPRPGEIVLARVAAVAGREIIKRVGGRLPGGYALLGDNPPASTDSRQFGSVPRAAITGRVLLRYWPDERRGRVR